MQGASAIDNVLTALPDRDLRAFLVWEPVLDSDRAEPSEVTQRRAADPRVEHFWDPTQRLATVWQPLLKADSRPLLGKASLVTGDVLWDFVGIFPPGVRWTGEAPPLPVFKAAPVAAYEAELLTALR